MTDAAVKKNNIGLFIKPLRCVFHALQPAFYHFIGMLIVILYQIIKLKFFIFAFTKSPVLPDNHTADNTVAAKMRNIVHFYSGRNIGNAEHLRNLPHKLAGTHAVRFFFCKLFQRIFAAHVQQTNIFSLACLKQTNCRSSLRGKPLC